MTRSASRRRRLSLACALTLCSAVALGGCSTFGGNIRGDFSCAAPDGICAPSSTIDDRALAMISAEGTDGDTRSEEHTSELQSLMRISYAVFCLKKKNIHTGIIQETK